MVSGLPASLTGRFAIERGTGTHRAGGWIGHTAVLDAVIKQNLSSLPGVEFLDQEAYRLAAILPIPFRFSILNSLSINT
jgi:hypothetical protein